MPELPEVETVRRRVQHALKGKRLVTVRAEDDALIFRDAPARTVSRQLRGRRVVGSGRKGKYFWLALDRRPWPVFHLGMSGWFYCYGSAADRPRHWKLEMIAEDETRVAMVNPRRLGSVRMRSDPVAEPPVSELGYDAADDLPDGAALHRLLAGRKAPIKSVLLDQSVLAGVGNWIADEVLYQSRIRPDRRACDLPCRETNRLQTAIRRVIDHAVAAEADDTRFPRTWLFHHRWGRRQGATTARGEAVVFDTIGGRTTAWVPGRQL